MKLPSFLSTCLGVAAGLLTLAASRARAEEKPPHILVILTDDMGVGDVACYGGSQPTPNIDSLAKDGTRFTQYYSSAPICSPSRVGMMTGMFPGRWRLTSFLQTRAGNRACEQVDFLDPTAPTFPRILKQAGYATAHFGKWHMGGGRDVMDAPKFAAYGYDEHASTWESPEPHPDITAGNWIWSPQDKVKRWERTAFFVDKTLDFLKRHHDQPCLVNLWPDDVHDPWVPGPDTPKGSIPRNFRPVLAEYDRQIGRLLEGLREQGIEKETLVIFASDNGPLPTFKGERAVGFRGSKLSLYEGGIRLPFIVRWPGHVPAGKVDELSVLAGTDLLPTLAAIAHAKLPEGVKFDGRDITAALTGTPSLPTAPLFWEYGRNETSFKFPGEPNNRSPQLAVREGKWKLLVNADGSGAELYDMDSDRGETRNLTTEQPETASRLKDAVIAWRKSLPALPKE